MADLTDRLRTITVIARRGDDQRSLGERALSGGLEHLRRWPERSIAQGDSERHRDNRALVLDGPVDASQDPSVRATAGIAQHFADKDLCLRGDTVPRELAWLEGTACRANTVGAVPMPVLDVFPCHERAADDPPAGE